jgi:hypothetical protein
MVVVSVTLIRTIALILKFRIVAVMSLAHEQLRADVRKVCRLLRLYCYSPYFSERSQAGWPDLTIVGPSGILFRELKTGTGRLTAAQEDVLLRLGQAGGDAAVWRDTDWTAKTIHRELFRLAGKRWPA